MGRAAQADRPVPSAAEAVLQVAEADAKEAASPDPTIAAADLAAAGEGASVAAVLMAAVSLAEDEVRCPHHRAENIASCSSGRIFWIAVFSRDGFTRFVRNTTYPLRPGSIHSVVPVNPV